MDSIKILIAGLLVFMAANVLTGCDAPKSEPLSAVGTERIETAREMIKTAALTATGTEDSGEIVVRLVLKNPDKSPVTSVQNWLAYNPAVLEGVSIDVKDSAFELVAPYENGFDQITGLVMLGRSSANAIKDEEIVIADIRFKRIGEGAAMIEAYDYRQDLSGHTSANKMVDGIPVNIMVKPQTPLITISQ